MNEQDEYETVKKEIRSLLITFKNGCSLFEFKNQYQMIMGHELPFMKFGFKNEIEFLCTMPDVSQITLTDRGYHLKVVTDQNTKHIQKLVSKQKTDKRKSVSHSSPIQSVAPPHGFHESYTPSLRNETKTRTKKELPSSIVDEVVALVCKYHAGLNMLDVLQRYRCCYEKELPFTSYGFFTLEEFLEAIPQVILKKTDNDIYLFCSSKLEDACPRLVEMNNPTRMCSNTLGVDPKEHGVKGELEMYKTFMKTVKEVADKSKAPVLNKAVVSRFVRNALWEPRKKYDQPRIKHSTSKENDSPFKQKMECLDVFNVESSLDSGKIKTDPIQLLPPNAISPLKRLEQQRLPTRLVLGSLFSAYVSNILSPEHMYIQLGDEEQALSDMNHALEKFYTDSESKTFVMKDIHILPGSTGVAQWPLDMHWYRIRVMSVISDGSVKVFFVDYGTMDNISKTLLRYIREDFFSFPAQAMKASLAYVKPPRGFRTWSQRATDKILELSLDESVKAEVEDIEDDVLLLTLYNKNGIYINGVLLDEHLAQATSVESKHREPVDLSDVTSPARSTPARDWPPIISSPSTESRQLSSTSCGSQSLNENLSTCANFSKSFEAALTSAIAPSTCAISEISQKKLVFNETPSPPKEAAVNLSNSPPSSNSEVFDDDTDAFFEYFYQKVSAVTKRYVKRIRTVDGYVFHILIYGSKPYVSCGDISHLIWSNKDSEFMLRRLQNSGSLPASVLIWEDENVNMFDQLKRFHVKGCKVMNDRTCLLIFSLNNLVEILNKFGHPSVELRTKIIHEYSAFNPNHPTWKELSEVEFSDGEEEFSDRTDDDKLNRLCLYDLQVMKENIRIRCQRLKLQESRSVANEEQKLHLLHEKVMLRINEIQQICSNFSNT